MSWTYVLGVSRGFGFLEFKSVSDAQDWMEHHKVCRVHYACLFFLSLVFIFVKVTSINITVFSYKPSTLELYCETIFTTGFDSISGTPVVRSNILLFV